MNESPDFLFLQLTSISALIGLLHFHHGIYGLDTFLYVKEIRTRKELEKAKKDLF